MLVNAREAALTGSRLSHIHSREVEAGNTHQTTAGDATATRHSWGVTLASNTFASPLVFYDCLRYRMTPSPWSVSKYGLLCEVLPFRSPQNVCYALCRHGMAPVQRK